LIPIIWLTIPKYRRVIFTAFLPLFFLTNLFRLSTDMINNHKLINFFLLFLAVETGIFVSHFLKRWWSFLPGIIHYCFVLTFSGFIDFFPDLKRSPQDLFQIFPTMKLPLGLISTLPKIVFSLPPIISIILPVIAGRKLFLDYGYFNWSMGYQEEARRRFVKSVFSSELTLDAVCQTLFQYGIDYVAISPGQGEVSENDPASMLLLI
jgi:hypothetical protein